MLEFLTGAGLALSAGLNAYIPLLAIGLASRFLEFVQLPDAWAWLENEWVLGLLGVLLVIEFFADKIPVVDSINDWVQTVVRPAAGGLAFGSGSTSETLTVPDPAAFFESNQWVPIVTGVVLALGVHLLKMTARPILNAVTVGAAASAASTAEDAGSLLVSIMAILLPILVIISVPLLAWWAWAAVSRAKRRTRPSG
ncbi:MAG TPA: DUF4126 domain-containing protein [Homoserinimonas sp.]|nr:DUF4126 domain-containing protein [Homoserinimonas sp.]